MDCHLFRRLCADLLPALLGSRVEKIHQPATGLTMFTLYGKGRKQTLLLRAGRTPFLFLSSHRLFVGAEPPASIMLLRKHLVERRFVDVRLDWPGRRFWLRMNSETPLWLELDLRDGPALRWQEPDVVYDAEPVWPDTAEFMAHLTRDASANAQWRDCPLLSPALRRVLTRLDPQDGAALLADLESGSGDVFLYEDATGARELSAWPLPEPLRAHRTEQVFSSPLEGAALAGEWLVLREVAAQRRVQAAKPFLAEAGRLRRLLDKLEREERRLADMAAARDDGLALQAVLYRHAPDAKADRVDVDVVDNDGQLTVRQLTLDPRLSIRENMAALFHKAARGKRGLSLLTERRVQVQAELDAAQDAALSAEGTLSQRAPTVRRSTRVEDGKKRGALPPKGVQTFRSSDGLLLLRGRDAKGNALLLRMGAGHDLWLHTGGAAGAHVLIRRDHAAQVVPERTLHEAGILAALKSEYKDATSAPIIMAQVKFVHQIKGARPGAVRIDRFEPSFAVTPDPAVETRLSLPKEDDTHV